MVNESSFLAELSGFSADAADYAARFVTRLLDEAVAMQVSDIHLQPVEDGLAIHWRLDGVLQPVGCFPRGTQTDVVTRLKVMSQLLTYRTDLPQEGRIRRDDLTLEMRVSTFPTLHGERAVIRLFAPQGKLERLPSLGLPDDVLQRMGELLLETAGALLITGPAGSGKSTTAYACLREILANSSVARSIVTLEDPIEVAIEGVAQSQVNSTADFDFAIGLRSLMRQDPEVILVGEIRDRETAEIALQASLTGHLLLSTFHAATTTGAVSRLADMGIEEYLLKSGIRAIVNQRLVRKLCSCKVAATNEADLLGLPVNGAWNAGRCEHCHQTGYRGRAVLAELLDVHATDTVRLILRQEDSRQLNLEATSAGMRPLMQRAIESIENGTTSPAEVRRVLGTLQET